MKLRIIKAYIKKEFTDLLRSKLILMVYVMPSMILILFGYGIQMQIKNARTVIIDHDNTKISNELILKFEHSKYFDTKVLNISENSALEMVKQAKTDIIIIIPQGFEKKLYSHQKPEIGIFIDGSFPVRAITMQGYVEGVLFNILKNKSFKTKKLITINQRNLFNESLRDKNAIVPGIIGLVLLVAPAILAALLIVKEKEIGTIFNFYSSAVTKTEFIIAKLIPPFILHSINIIILLLIAIYLFKVPFRGNIFLYFLASEIYIIVSIGIGLLVSVVTNTQIVALVLIVIITIIPGFLYSGILMPISSMAGASFIEAHIFPVMYYNHIIYDTFLVNEGFKSIINIKYLFILFFYAVFLISLGSFLLKKEIR